MTATQVYKLLDQTHVYVSLNRGDLSKDAALLSDEKKTMWTLWSGFVQILNVWRKTSVANSLELE